MASNDLRALEKRCQSIASTTENLANDLAQLQNQGLDMTNFQAIQSRECRLLASTLPNAAKSVQSYHPKSLLASMKTVLVAEGGWRSATFKVSNEAQTFLTLAIELIKTIERRVEDYKRKVTVQSEVCTYFFAKASSNKSNLESLGDLISTHKNATSREIGVTRQRLSKCNHELAEDQKQLSLARHIETKAFKRKKHWKKVNLCAKILKDVVGKLTSVEDT